jgi:SAM-dependent methyltransferase
MMPAKGRKVKSSEISIRSRYEAVGADAFYRDEGDDYRNPHEPQIADLLGQIALPWKLDFSHVLDLAAGSGEVTLALRELGAKRIVGIDPFTFRAYEKRTRQTAEKLTFADIAAGGLRGRRYSLIVCSFALHLCEPSRLPAVAQALSEIAPSLLLIMPHKRPVLRPAWRWTLREEIVIHRVRARLFAGRTTGCTTGFQPVRMS